MYSERVYIMRIAIIDNEEFYHIQIKRWIDKFLEEFYYSTSAEVAHFLSAEQFLETFQNRRYQVIFIEICLGGMSGLELARQIRKLDNQVLLVFETSNKEGAVEGYKVQAKGYLIKPFTYILIIKLWTNDNIIGVI